MNTLCLTIAELYRLSGLPLPDPVPSPEAVLALARRFFAFLPEPPGIAVDGDSIVVHYKEQEKEGVDNPELLKSMASATDMYLLNALQRYAGMTVEQVQKITFEIGFLAQGGLDFDDPAPKHSLSNLPGETFSALQLMCLMFAGFQRFAPEKDLGMNLHASFLRALTLYTEVIEE